MTSRDVPRAFGKRFHQWLRGKPGGLVALSLAVGIGAGLGAIGFRYLITWFTLLFTGHADYAAADHQINPWLPQLGIWFVALAPVVGGAIYGPIVAWLAPEARGHGVPEVMFAVAEGGGRIRPRVAIVKALASALCIGSGGSVGREGPIVQIGSALGSALGQVVRVPELRLRLLVACGAAGGISATFNAPIAGVMFALELILRDLEAESLGMVVLASVAANVVGQAAFGSQAFLALPPFDQVPPITYGLYAGLGVLAAVVGVAFIRVLYATEDWADRVWKGPAWLRPAAGGVLVGLVLLVLPQLYGVGYPAVETSIRGGFSVSLLMILVVGKIVATSLTIAIGGSGGVFAPSMFMGAMLGSAFGALTHRWFPGIAGAPGAYGVVAMGAVFAAAGRAPITSAVVIYELTGESKIILPLLFAVAVSTAVASILSRDTIYTVKLRRRGVELLGARAPNPMAFTTVEDAMQPMPTPLRSGEPMKVAVQRLNDEGRDALPIVDADGHYQGTLTARAIEEAMRENDVDVDVERLGDVRRTVGAGDTLEQALGALVQPDNVGVAVVGRDKRSVVGWLTRADVLRAYQERTKDGSNTHR